MNSLRYSVIPVVLILAALPGCTQKHAGDDEESQSSGTAMVVVKVAAITTGNVDVMVTSTGKTDALRKVRVLSPIAGRIQSLDVVEGMAVKVGDLLAVIQSKETHAAIAGAEELLQSARTPEEKDEAERTLSLAKSTQNSVIVRAKSNGVVSTRSINAGEVVAEDTELLTLVDLSSIDFVADVPLRDLPSVHKGQAATITFPSLPAHTFNARLDAIYPQTDEQSQSIKVRLGFRDRSLLENARLRTEMAGVANIVIGTHRDAFLVPKSALIRNDENDTYSIVTITPDSLSKAVRVTVGEVTDSTAEIRSSDIKAGLSVITTGNYALPDSTRVSVEHP